jgi:hypothetical protein
MIGCPLRLPGSDHILQALLRFLAPLDRRCELLLSLLP